MENLMIEESINRSPYLKKMTSSTIFTTEEDMDNLLYGEKIKVDGEYISIEFLFRVLKDDEYYRYASNFLDGKINDFMVSGIINDDIGSILRYNKSLIVKGLLALDSERKIVLPDELQARVDTLCKKVSFEKFLENYKDSFYDIEIDGNKYSISVDQIIDFMRISEEEFNRICNDEVTELNGMPKEYFVYAAYNFFMHNRIYDNFILPEAIIDRYEAIRSMEKIDIQAINSISKTEDELYLKINLDQELEKIILEGMPEDATTIEKAIYIYIKMCRIFTYDDEYYAIHQQGEAAKKHQDISYISSLNLENRKLVCFEFNLIYDKFLNMLGINFQSIYNMGMNGYGEGHASSDFRCGKYLVVADSVTSILEGDLINAKLNKPLKGLICINKSEKTRAEFQNVLEKMYNLVISQEDRYKEKQLSFDDLLGQYIKKTENYHNVPLKERFDIFGNKIKVLTGEVMDVLSYVLNLTKTIFNDSMRNNNIQYTIVRSNDTNDNRVATALGIIVLNDKGFNQQENNQYFILNSGVVEAISKEELQRRFDDRIYEYIYDYTPPVVGLDSRGRR